MLLLLVQIKENDRSAAEKWSILWLSPHWGFFFLWFLFIKQQKQFKCLYYRVLSLCSRNDFWCGLAISKVNKCPVNKIIRMNEKTAGMPQNGTIFERQAFKKRLFYFIWRHSLPPWSVQDATLWKNIWFFIKTTVSSFVLALDQCFPNLCWTHILKWQMSRDPNTLFYFASFGLE